MRLTVGKGAGILGGMLTVAGTALPWAAVSGGTLSRPLYASGISIGWGGWTVLGFGLLGAVLSARDRPVAAGLALELGILALFLTVMAGLSLPAIARDAGGVSATLSLQVGLFVTLAGSAILLAGGAANLRERSRRPKGIAGKGAAEAGQGSPPPPPAPPPPGA